jgi:hypothetical protein
MRQGGGMKWRHGLAAFYRLRERRWWRIGVNAAAVVAMLAFVGIYLARDGRQLLSASLQVDPRWLAAALAVYGGNYALFVLVWHRIVGRFDPLPGWRQNMLLYSYTQVTRYLPTPAWFFASRIYLYGKAGLKRRVVLAMTVLETLLHVVAGAAFYGLLMIDPTRPASYLYGLAVIPAGIAVIRPGWLQMRALAGGPLQPGIRRRDVLAWLGWYMATWVTAGPFLTCIMRAFAAGSTPNLVEAWRAWTLSGLVAYAGTYTLGGVAVLREFTLTWLLSGTYSPPVALVITVGSRVLMTVGGLLWALIAIGVAKLGGAPDLNLPPAQPQENP